MLERIKQFLRENESARLILAILIGAVVGVIFYPTKTIQERERQKHEQELVALKEQHIKETSLDKQKIDALKEQNMSLKVETEKKITSLNTQIRDLKSKQKTAYYKIVRPDGTIEIKKFTESEIDESNKVVSKIQEEYKQKVELLEQKWETIHQERVVLLKKEFDQKESSYKKKISELEYDRKIETNKKDFGLEAGITTDKTYYSHATYTFLGPLFLGLDLDFSNPMRAGAGLGIRF